MGNNRKHKRYSDYIENVVNECGHKWIILERKDFRSYTIDVFNEIPSIQPTGKLVKIVPARCKSYSCPICGRKKVYDLIERLNHVDLKGYRFFTLTLKNEYSQENTEKNLCRISECFTKLLKKLRKKPEFKKMEYFKVLEVGKDGMVHIHGIWNKYIEKEMLSKFWYEITGDSFLVKPERIKSKNDAVRYLFKYLTKNIQDDAVDLYDNDFFGLNLTNTAKLFYQNGKRRYSASRNFFSKTEKLTGDYVPYWFESDDSHGVEVTVKNLVEKFKLKADNFDFSLYDESDQFLQTIFDSS